MGLLDDDFPPLDIHAAAVAIAREVDLALREALRAAGPEVYLPLRSPLSRLPQMIQQILLQYDAGRTEHLRFLKSELMRLHNVTVQPAVLLKVPQPDD